MSISFNGTVTGTRIFGENAIVTVKEEDGKFPQFVDCKFPASDAPDLQDGTPITVEFRFLPQARGYESNKVNPKTGKPYINGVVVLWKPTITPVGVQEDIADPDTFGDDIPF